MKKNSLKAILSVLLVMLLLSVFGANTALAVAVPSRYTEMKVDDTYYITIGRGEEAYVKFTPKASGTYVLESSCLNDVKVVIYDAAMTVLGSDDNGKDEENFRIVCNLTGGTTYYYGITFAQATRYGQCPVTLTCRGTDCAHAHYKETADSGPTCHFDGYTAGKWCEDCEYWFEGHVKIEGGHKDENNDDVCERCRGEMPYQTNLCGPIEQPHLVKYERYADQSIVIFGTGEMKTGAFQGDDLLKKVTILPGVTKVMDNAFYDCGNLTTVILPDTIDDIRHDSFNSCDTLETINIPDGVKFIGYCAFSYCRALKNITIPDTVRGIGLEAFAKCEGLESITIGKGVEQIDQKTFYGCKSLTSIVLNDTMHSIRANAFEDCTKLATVTLGKNIRSVGASAFKNCTSLTELHFAQPLDFIGANAFDGCTALHTISLPATLTTIGEKAFNGCNGLQTVYYGGTETQWNNISIGSSNSWLTARTRQYNSCLGKETHAYDNGCDTACNDCGATRVTEHKYDNACDKSCNNCGTTRVTAHRYDGGAVTKPATCKVAGVKTYTCTVCKATKTETIAKKTTHTYTNACDKSCNVCGATRTVGAHKYTNACDKTCNTCGATRTTSHSYTKKVTKATLTANGKIQNVCKVCGYTASTSTTIYRPTSFKLSATSYTYNGAVKTPSVTVKDAAGKTISSSNYTVTYATGRKNAGTYSVKITMKGNYAGTKTLSFKINPISISKCKLSLSATSYTYDGKTKTPSVVVKNASGTKLTTSSYTVTYATGRKNVGTYKVTIKMKGNYSGTKTLTFKVNPAKTTVSKVTPATKSLKVSITKKSTQVTGYQIQYSTSKTFKSVKTVNISSYKTTSTTIKSLKAKTTYYVRVRTYKTVGGVKYYSGWSTVKYAKTK